MKEPRRRISDRAFTLLIRLYPKSFRERFGDGMRISFASEADEARRRGAAALGAFWLSTLWHTAGSAMVERATSAEGVLDTLSRGLVVDIRHATRRLLKSPGFTLAAAATLALGVGATTAMLGLVRGVILNPLPYPDSGRLMALQHSAEGAGLPIMGLSHGTFVHYRAHSEAFEEIAAYTPRSFALQGTDGAQRVAGATVTQGFFEIFLGQPPALGRSISDLDQVPGAPAVAMISDDLWRSRFGADPNVLGQTLRVEGTAVELIGVLPPWFDVPTNTTQLWLAQRLDPERVILGGFGRFGVGRTRPGVTRELAQAELAGLVPRLAERFNPTAFDLLVTGGGLTPVVTPLRQQITGGVSSMLWILLGTVVFVLGIACANVANLFLVRAENQSREIAIRSALGAGRGRVIRHHLLESLMLAATGGVIGIVLATFGIRWVVAWGPNAIPRLHEVSIDGVMVGFAVAISVAAGLAFGLIPARGLRKTGVALSDGSRGNTAGPGRHRVRNSLVVAQVSLALVLLVGAGLMVRTFAYLRSVDPGLDSSSALVFQVGLPPALYPDRVEAFQFQQQILRRISALPGVSAAGATACLPFDGCDGRTPVYPADLPVEPGRTPPSVDVRGITAGYFDAVGVRVIEGRDLTANDPYQDPAVAVVSQNLAERVWPGRSAIGRQIYPDFPEEDPYTIVGVVEDIRAHNLTDSPPEMLYLSFLGPYWYVAPPHALTFVAKTDPPPLSLAPAVRRVVEDLDPNVPISNLRTFQEVLDRATAPTAFAMILLVGAGAAALALGSIGVYGVLSYTVGQRTSEIGVRMAMGAEANQISRMILRHAAKVVGLGAVIGFFASVLLTRVMEAVLYGVQAFDPTTYAAVAIGLGSVAFLASYLPARRAASLNPITSLRAD